MDDVYVHCPQLDGENFTLRQTVFTDAEDLLKVYSDEKAVPNFNSDNCDGDDFHYTTVEQMTKEIEFWDYSFEEGYFVRWSIIDKEKNKAVGTIELFNRNAKDYFNNCGIMRIDLASAYETEKCLSEIINIIEPVSYELFECEKIATKGLNDVRRSALISCGFIETDEKLKGLKKEYSGYYVKEKQRN